MDKSFEQTGVNAGTFGERLRRERERRGISLDDIAASTKIGTRLLRALEEEHFDLLPGGIFNKGYVRAYARYVGIDEEQAVADYLRSTSEAAPDVRLIAHQNASTHGDSTWPVDRGVSDRHGLPLIPIVILLLVVAGAAGGWHLYQQRQRERPPAIKAHDLAAVPPTSADQATGPKSNSNHVEEQTGPPPSAPGSQNAAAPAVTANPPSSGRAAVQTVEAAERSPHSSAQETEFEVTVRAKDRARVEIKSDGEVVVRGIISPPEVKTFHATNRLVFWTANAGEVELSFNGKSVPLHSGANDEQVLIFNSRGLQSPPATQ